MTKAEARAELSRLKDLFRLHDWRTPLKLKHGADLGNGNGAEIFANREAKTALIRLAVGCCDEEAHRRLRHEVLHLALVELTDALNPFMESLPKQLREVAARVQVSAEEQVVERLERAFAELTP